MIVNYIRGYEDRLQKARHLAKLMAQHSIGGPAFKTSDLLDPEAGADESSVVNSWLHDIQGIDAVIEMRGSIIPVYLMKWHGPNKEDPSHHDWAAYPRDYWDDYQRKLWDASQYSPSDPLPKLADPLEVAMDLDGLHQKIWQSLQI